MTTEQEPLTAMDRCDRCRAPARARTQHENGTLLWCRHHYDAYEPRLAPNLVFWHASTEDEPTKAGVR
jgi:hypothetical protein